MTFWQKLFEFEFRHFITPSIVKILYILGIIGASFSAVIVLISGLAALGDSAAGGLFLILLAPAVWLLSVVYWRVLLELLIALIRTAQNTRDLVERQGGGTSGF